MFLFKMVLAEKLIIKIIFMILKMKNIPKKISSRKV